MSSPSRDLDGDGLCEDMDGNGSLDFFDVELFFENIGSQAIQNNPELFDFNQNGGIDLADVVTLNSMVQSSPPFVANEQADIFVDEDAVDTLIDLSNTFDDADIESRGDSLVLIVSNNTNPNLVVLSLDDTTLTLGYTDDMNGISEVAIQATDRSGKSIEEVFIVTVNPVNDAPSITSSPVTIGAEDQLYTYDVEATDPDTEDMLTYSLVVSPEGMSIDSDTGLINWTPNASQVGGNLVTVRVQDTGDLFDTQYFTIEVIEMPQGVSGDQNGDGNVDVFDAIIDLQIIVGKLDATETQLILSDVVRDGVINVFDVILTLQHIVGVAEITECGPP